MVTDKLHEDTRGMVGFTYMKHVHPFHGGEGTDEDKHGLYPSWMRTFRFAKVPVPVGGNELHSFMEDMDRAEIVTAARLYPIDTFHAYMADNEVVDHIIIGSCSLIDWSAIKLSSKDIFEYASASGSMSGSLVGPLSLRYDNIRSIANMLAENILRRIAVRLENEYGIKTEGVEAQSGIVMAEGEEYGVIIEPTWIRPRRTTSWWFVQPFSEIVYQINQGASTYKEDVKKMLTEFSITEMLPPVPCFYRVLAKYTSLDATLAGNDIFGVGYIYNHMGEDMVNLLKEPTWKFTLL